MGRSTFSKRLVAISVMLMFVIPVVPFPTIGTTELIDDFSDFQGGGFEGTVYSDQQITLDKNATMADNWTLIDYGSVFRTDIEMVYVASKGEFFTTHGRNGPTYMTDTFAYNMTNDTWYEIKPTNTINLGRTNYSMAYDPVNDLVYLYGGMSPGLQGELWYYDCSQNTWTLETMGPTNPGARQGMSMVYEGEEKKLFLFGGDTGSFPKKNDTWEYSISTNLWVNVESSSIPPGRYDHAIAHDTTHKKTVLFGGTDGNGLDFGDTYIYDHTTDKWHNVPLSGDYPDKRRGHTMAYDAKKDRVFLYGGVSGTPVNKYYNDTWIFDVANETWEQVEATHTPNKGEGFAMGFHTNEGEMVVLTYDKTWVFDRDAYLESGYLTSRAFEVSDPAYFGKFMWDSTTPTGTSVKLQFRSAETSEALAIAPFKGSDGINGSFYLASGDPISKVHYGHRYFQYRALLETTDIKETPILDGVTIRYNLIHNISMVAPVAGENVTGVYQVQWDAVDPDGDGLNFTLLFETQTDSYVLVENYTYQHFDWETDTLPNGTYRICVVAQDDSPTIPLERTACTGWFNVSHNGPPTVTLLGPEDGAILDNDWALLSWEGVDDDNDTITYTVLFDDVDGSSTIVSQSETGYNATGLTDGKTYYWTIRSNDGKGNGSVPPVRSFHVDINYPPTIDNLPPMTIEAGQVYHHQINATDVDDDILTYELVEAPNDMVLVGRNITWTTGDDDKGEHNLTIQVSDGKNDVQQHVKVTVVEKTITNHRPTIVSTPVTTAYVGTPYEYQVSAVDLDPFDTLNYSLSTRPDGMVIDPSTGKITWMPTLLDLAETYSVIVKVDDGTDSDSQSFTVIVLPASSNNNPTISSSPPKTKIEVGQSFVYNVLATDPNGDTLMFALTESPSGMTINMNTGQITWTPTESDIGTHSVEVTVADSKGGYAQQQFTLEVTKKATPPPNGNGDGDGLSGLLPYLLLLIVIIIVIAVIAVFAMRKKAPGPDISPAVTHEPGPTSDAAFSSAAEDLPPPTPPPVPPAPAVVKEAPKPLPVIDDIFLVYTDGRLISHHTRKLRPDMDDQLLTGMFTAVQGFIKSSLGGKGKSVNEITYGDQKILIEHGRYIFIAAVIEAESEGTKDMHTNMKAALHNIEFEFGDTLREWEGDVNDLEDAKSWIKMLIAGEPIEKV